MSSNNEEHYLDYVTTGQVAKLCGVSTSTVIRWIKNGQLQAFSLPSGHYRVPRKNLISFLKDNEMIA